jgi:hypothetical protein
MTQLATLPTNELATVQPSILGIIDNAVEKGVGPDALAKMWETYREMEAYNARKAFAMAMARFGASCPPVQRRTRSDQFQTTRRDGTRAARMYASLEDISAAIRAPLAENGLSFRWTDMNVKDGVMTVTCIVSHQGGHSESSSVSLPVVLDVGKGANEAQKAGIIQTYAMRYSLIQALGLTSCDEDTDGSDDPAETITDEQALEIEAALADLNVDRGQFLAYMKASTIAGIPASKLGMAKAAIETKRQKVREGKK